MIKKDHIYGSFRAVKKLDDKFGCICIHCETKKKFSEKKLLKKPICDCQAELLDKQKDLNVILSEKLTSYDVDNEQYSMFQEQVKIISDRLKDEPENPVRQFQLANLKLIIDLIPSAEKELRNNFGQSKVYALNGLITQARELIADLQATDDTQELINDVVMNIIQPQVNNFANATIQFNFDLKTELNRLLAKDDQDKAHQIIDNLTRSFGRELNTIFVKIQDEVRALNE